MAESADGPRIRSDIENIDDGAHFTARKTTGKERFVASRRGRQRLPRLTQVRNRPRESAHIENINDIAPLNRDLRVLRVTAGKECPRASGGGGEGLSRLTKKCIRASERRLPLAIAAFSSKKMYNTVDINLGPAS